MLGALLLALLQPAAVQRPDVPQPGIRQPAVDYSSPPGGDTTGYWQQRASYTVVGTLDEAREVLEARGTLTYVNHSPDTLREFFVHQHLNAFRPGSDWARVDAREGRVRFQHLGDPDYAYERFTAVPTFDGVPVRPEYPGAPDSTVARFDLPRPLLPGDTVRVAFAWEARPSTTPRRQARRGRSYDFAQWYPRVAVYDRDGWRPYPLRPAGEFYGEFGDWDVTLVLRDDQVLGTTGVVVDGDPGWAGALRAGVVARQPAAYAALASAPAVEVPEGHKRVRVVARDVHHFGWSASPDYRYEGGWYLRPDSARATRFPTWDSVGVHVLYQPGDTATWGNGQVLARTNVALRWLERVFGPYAYPQMTVLHRIEGGGTEFPMLQMNGSPSLGLNLHEGGHVFAHGILANNEWRAGWMDEGLSSYQTAWQQRLTPQDRPRLDAAGSAPRDVPGYAGRAVRPDPDLDALTAQARLDLLGRTEPLGFSSEDYRDFGTYNAMVYGRGEHMFGALRDAIGDDAFSAFLRTYYDRWALRHVDEPALRAAAEAAAGRDLSWFFDQWVHRTGVVDYALSDVRVRRDDGGWVTTGRVRRTGDYRHPMPVGVLTAAGWTLARADALPDEQTVAVRTSAEPTAVRLDPLRTTPDWHVPSNADVALARWNRATSRVVFDYPLLDQQAADRYVTALAPLVWYSRPLGVVPAVRLRSSYLGAYDRLEVGLAYGTRLEPAAFPPLGDGVIGRTGVAGRLQGWVAIENPQLFGRRPAMGLSAGVWHLDGLTKAEVARRWERTRPGGRGARTHGLAFTGTYPFERALLDGRRWSGRSASDLTYTYAGAGPAASGTRWQLAVTGGALVGDGVDDGEGSVRPYAKAEAWWAIARGGGASRWSHRARLHAAASSDVPPERAVHVSAATPTATFGNHFWRPDGGIFSNDDVNYRPLGGAGMRGYDPLISGRHVVAVNVEEALRVARFGPATAPLDLEVAAFGDAGVLWADGVGETLRSNLADAGVGLLLRGQLFDRPVRVRLDAPLYVSDPGAAIGARGRDASTRERLRVRWAFSLNDLW